LVKVGRVLQMIRGQAVMRLHKLISSRLTKK
jgi:hypothetical protein